MRDVTPTAAFPATYAEARDRFRAAAERRGWSLSSRPIDRVGPSGEALTIDAAVAPGSGAAGCLIVSSGLHGVEGPFGSAVQLAYMDRGEAPSTARLVFLHALNPYGYAWSRRFNEDNVDPNRNFLLDGEDYAGSPAGYAALDGLLNALGPPTVDGFLIRAWWQILRRGLPALKEAVAVGQYEFPRGLFFGGRGPSRTLAILRDGLPTWLGTSSRVVHLDLHTGLGRWGSCKLLIDHPIGSATGTWLNRHFGPESYEGSNSTGVAYRARGSLGYWCRERLEGRSYLGLCAEFGTYGPLRILAGLRDENRAHHWGDPTSPSSRRAKAKLCELFVPVSPTWREAALKNGLDGIDRAARGLLADRSIF